MLQTGTPTSDDTRYTRRNPSLDELLRLVRVDMWDWWPPHRVIYKSVLTMAVSMWTSVAVIMWSTMTVSMATFSHFKCVCMLVFEKKKTTDTNNNQTTKTHRLWQPLLKSENIQSVNYNFIFSKANLHSNIDLEQE